jgi:periplasmic protein TonB
MFKDSTFESAGRIRTRSRRWMIATFVFNGLILLALILIPLIYPEALPRQSLTFLLTAPAPPPTPPPAPRETAHAIQGKSEMPNGVILAPPKIPNFITKIDEPKGSSDSFISMNEGPGLPDAASGVFVSQRTVQIAHPDLRGPVHVSSGVMEGTAILKTSPIYPAIAREAGVQGTVVLMATISRNGTIENLRVASGPAMLRQAAIEAVKTWRYRPYLLNGEPVEVETTVNVVFSLGH